MIVHCLLDSKKLAVRHKDWNFRFGGNVKFQYDDDFFTAGNSAALARTINDRCHYLRGENTMERKQ